MSILNSLVRDWPCVCGSVSRLSFCSTGLCACFIVHPPQFSWSELLVQMLQSFYLGEITVWFRVVVWLTDRVCFRCHSSMCHGIIKGKTRRQFCPLPNACTWGGSPWGQPCLSCLSSPGSCDAPQQQLPLKERQQSLLPRGLRQHWPLVTSVAKLLVSFGKHTQRSLLMNIMDKF